MEAHLQNGRKAFMSSSRSHSIYTITIESTTSTPTTTTENTSTTTTTIDNNNNTSTDNPERRGERSIRRVAKLQLVDMGGSERVRTTGVPNDLSLIEAAKIASRTFYAFGSVIHALVKQKPTHIPYRYR